MFCPKCGNDVGTGGDFCTNCGAKIRSSVSIGKSSKRWIWVVASGFILIIAVVGSYLYFSGYIIKNPAKVQQKINVELWEKGLSNVFVGVSKDWVATVGGSVSDQFYKDEALSIVKKHEEIKDTIDNIQLQQQVSDSERDMNKANNLPSFEIIEPQSGKKFNSSAFKGKVLLLSFWSTWAVSATDTSPFIERIYRTTSNDDNFLILTILYKDNLQDALNYVKSHGYTFPLYLDPGNNVSKLFGVTGVPEIILIDRHGAVKKKNIGPLIETDANQWLQEIKNLELM